MNQRLFVYGTLREKSTQRSIIGRITECKDDVLLNYRKSRMKVEGKFYPVALPSKGDSINGLVISLSADDIRKIDRYETSAYKRVRVKLKSGNTAFVYIKS